MTFKPEWSRGTHWWSKLFDALLYRAVPIKRKLEALHYEAHCDLITHTENARHHAALAKVSEARLAWVRRQLEQFEGVTK